MIVEVRNVQYGREASEALASTITAAKSDRALAPVTVLVPSNLAGLSVRRLLGAGLVGAGRGIANVSFVTPFRLAELLAAGHLGDRRPLTNPVLGAAVRRVLATEPGSLAPVAEHEATEQSVAALYAELSRVSENTLARLQSAGGRSAEVVRLFRDTAALLEGFHDESDVAEAAASRPDLARALEPFGHFVWHLPEPMAPALVRLVSSVLGLAPSSVIIGLVGDESADEAILAACRKAGVDVAAAASSRIESATGSRIVSVTDPDEEVRAVVRRIVAVAEDGVKLDRIGVFYPRPDPYVRLLRRHLRSAGLPANGPAPERLADSAAGRTLLGALGIPKRQWRRDHVMALVSAAPVCNGTEPVRPATWEVLSRRVGVVRGLEDWRRKLDAHADRIRAELEALDAVDTETGGGTGSDGDQEAWARSLGRALDDTRELRRFIDDLAAGVASVEAAKGWRDKAGAARDLLVRLTGGLAARRSWPEAEQEFADRIEDALSRLATLEEIDPDPADEVFRRALAAELEGTRGREGRFGEGVVYGPVISALGQDLDAVFVLGMAEGDCPSPRRDDALLPDHSRALADGELRVHAESLHEQHRHLLAALAAAPAGRRTLTFARGDLRSSRHRLPSRWLLDTASSLAGKRIYSTAFPALDAPVVDVVPSHASGLLSDATPGDILDRDLADVSAHLAAGGDWAEHPSLAPLARGIECMHARRSSSFTEWDGNLEGQEVPSPARGDLQSATRLERWAACGFRYFLADVLHLSERDDPARIVELSPLDRGSGVHEILERFFTEVIDGGPPAPDQPWSDGHRERLRDIAEEVLDRYERSGRTGRSVNWQVSKRRLMLLVDTFLGVDDQWRSEAGATPVRVELPFGLDGVDPVAVTLGDGREILFRGRADRVDRTGSGGHVVFDYKTGKGTEYERIDESDPVKGGTTLQLGLYSEAVRSLLGAGDSSAYYWMVNDEVNFVRHGYEWNEERRDRFVAVVRAIVEGIESGAFPANPGDWQIWWKTHDNCRHCEFDSVCPRDRGEQAEAKSSAPGLAQRKVLVPDEVDE